MKLCDSVTGSLNRTPSFNLKMFRKSVDESNSEESRKIRRHTPVGSGEYSVGCWDMMCGGPTEKGYVPLVIQISIFALQAFDNLQPTSFQ